MKSTPTSTFLRKLLFVVLLVLMLATPPALASPTNAPLQNISTIAAGGAHTCALTNAGGVKCWGDNYQGQLGGGTGIGIHRPSPVDVVGLGSGVSAIAGGMYHTCALTGSDGVKCWGFNDNGQLGDGTAINRPSPVDVVGLGSGVSAIAAGLYDACALTNAGGVKCWGGNSDGQLGDGTAINRPTPVDVVGLGSEVSAITAGGIHTCALTDAGGVKCWGDNQYGQLGDGTRIDSPSPVDVVGLGSGVSAIAAGRYHTCALASGGGVRCWGANHQRQLGDGTTTTYRPTPVDVVGLGSGVSAIAAGYEHTCALTDGGGVKCWGGNSDGQLGDGTAINRPTPVDVVGLGSGAIAITAGWHHTCALTGGGGVKCWGGNSDGQLGDGTLTNRLTPVDVVDGGTSSDTTPPAAILDLAATTGSTSGTVDLTWTAPGDDGTTGTATSYIVRYWDYPIGTELGWATATDVDGEPIPQAAGNTETMTISGLTPGQTYYFMVRAEDEAANRSDLGNSPSAVAAEGAEVIDLTISLYKVADTAAARAPYEHILEFFADAVYEMSNGAHKIGTVTIYQGGASSDTANINWKAEEWPCANVAGYTESGQVFMGDVFPFPNNSFNALAESNWRGAGYTLAHEFGHYYYGLYDEYKASSTDDDNNSIFPHSDDKPATNSVMNSHWSAVSGNFNWLNFSIAKNNTRKTAQHRMYAASGWETLARPVSEDPRDGYRLAEPIRTYYDELATVAPEPGQNASLQLPDDQSEARNQLNITWLDGSGGTQDYVADVRSTFGEILEYPRTVVLVAKVSKDYPIAKAGLTASTQAPDGTVTPLTLKDDGSAPDIVANDGLYSGLMPYNQGGSHILNVAFNNNGSVAEETRISYAHTTGPNGETYQDMPQLISENFDSVATATITITDFKTDDHGDTAQTATNLLPTNVDVPGRIDRSGDIDMFKVIPSETGQLIVRVSGLAFDMQPKIQILSADGQTAVDEFDFTPQGNEYFFTPVNTQASLAFYIVISHSNQNAAIGSYDISVGSPLTGSQESGSSVYLPIILK